MNTTLLLVIVFLLTAALLFFILPGLFNNIKKYLYLKKNKGYSDGLNVKNSMFYNARKGEIEADQLPLH